MKIIDSHVHIGLNEFCDSNSSLQYNLENKYLEYIKIMKEAGIDKACILPIPDDGFDVVKSNKYLKLAKNTFPDNFIPICRLNDELIQNVQGDFCGAKLHKVYENIKKSKLIEYYKLMEYYDIPLIVHAEFKNKVKQIQNILKVAPKLRIILAHMGRGHIYTVEGIEENLKLLKKYDNVFFETSTTGNSEIINKAVNVVGSSRIMFGSDYPFGKIYFGKKYNYKDEIQTILNANLNGNQLEDVLYNTAYNVFFNNSIKDRESYIALYNDNYKEEMNELFNVISAEDKKFLAIDHKMSVVKDCMRKHTHLFVIIYKENFAGYMRESGRPNNESLLEELVILPQYRGCHLSKIALGFYKNRFPKNYAKTNSKNLIMNSILRSEGYKCVAGEKILNWEYGE